MRRTLRQRRDLVGGNYRKLHRHLFPCQCSTVDLLQTSLSVCRLLLSRQDLIKEVSNVISLEEMKILFLLDLVFF